MRFAAAPRMHEDPVSPAPSSRQSGLLAATLLCATLLVTTGCATTGKPAAPTLAEVIQMSENGVADDQIITRLRDSNAVYPLSASQILDLSSKGVSAQVLDYMQQAYLVSERRRERLMYGNPYWPGHYWGYPCLGCPYPYFGQMPFYIYVY